MKKRISLILSVVLLALAIFSVLPAAADITMVEVTKSVSVRSQPSFGGDKLTLARPGTQYPYIRTEGKWYEVELSDGKTGWLPDDSSKLVTAPGVPVGSAQAAFNTLIRALKKGDFEGPAPEVFTGKAVIALYYNLDEKAEEYSTEALEEGYYRQIDSDYLAPKMEEADWALLLYPTFEEEEGRRVVMHVFAADVKNSLFYEPYEVDDRGTVLTDGENEFELDSTFSDMYYGVLYPKWEKAYRIANDEDYQAGLQFMKEGKYYSAMESFRMSSLDEAWEMIEKCVQTWPKNGEIWHTTTQKGKNVTLNISVNQNSERGMLIKLYKNGEHISSVFLHGTGKATTKVPAGVYTFKQGIGYEWYGLKEAFGRDGSYATMVFGDNEVSSINLTAGTWELTINTDSRDPNGTDVDTEPVDYDSYVDD